MMDSRLHSLKEYLKQNPFSLDLIWVEDSDDALKFHWAESIKSAVQIFAKTGTGSLIGIWHTVKDSTAVIWIDNERIPTSVFANSLKDFLSLLHYGSGVIYEILIDLHYFNIDPSSYPDPLKKFHKKYLKELIEIEVETYNDNFVKFKKWLTDDLKIKQQAHPVEMIYDSIQAHPDFLKWFNTLN